jgi:hypothetical protein
VLTIWISVAIFTTYGVASREGKTAQAFGTAQFAIIARTPCWTCSKSTQADVLFWGDQCALSFLATGGDLLRGLNTSTVAIVKVAHIASIPGPTFCIAVAGAGFAIVTVATFDAMGIARTGAQTHTLICFWQIITAQTTVAAVSCIASVACSSCCGLALFYTAFALRHIHAHITAGTGSLYIAEFEI